MNERIRELAEQADGVFIHKLLTGAKQYTFLEKDLEKFALLIVRECVSTLNEMHMWQSVNNQNYPSAWHDAVDNGIETIKEHFGVEE